MKCLVRVDFNVPIAADGTILDNSRIQATLPTLRMLLKRGDSLILISHMGKPKGKIDSTLSLRPCARELEKLLGIPVVFIEDCIGEKVQAYIDGLAPGQVVLLENLRFYEGEEHPEKDPTFAPQLARLAEGYVNDAFGCSHRPHASIVALPKLFEGKREQGLLIKREVEVLTSLLQNPQRPFLAILGGAKVSSKCAVIKKLLEKVDQMVLGGGLAMTFLMAKGVAVGGSLVELDFLEEAKELVRRYPDRLLLPQDLVVATALDQPGVVRSVEKGLLPQEKAFDIGPQTVKQFKSIMEKAETILWNGPMGVFEQAAFARGTEQIARAFVHASAVTVAGGGETLAALAKIEGHERVTHLSTGGGATLEFLEKGTLPGLL